MIGRGLFAPFRDRYRQIQKPVQFARTGRLNFNVAHCQAQCAPGSTLQPGAGRRGERGPGDGRARDHEFPNEAVTPIRVVGREGDRANLATLGTGEAIELPQLALVSGTKGRPRRRVRAPGSDAGGPGSAWWLLIYMIKDMIVGRRRTQWEVCRRLCWLNL
jgi:hypothetical protein